MKRLSEILPMPAILMLGARSSSPLPTDETKSAPANRVFAFKGLLDQNERAGELIIKRDPYVGGGIDYAATIFLNDAGDKARLAKLCSGEKLVLYPTPGRHIIGARVPGVNPTTEVFLAAGETTVCRLSYSRGSGFHLRPEQN